MNIGRIQSGGGYTSRCRYEGVALRHEYGRIDHCGRGDIVRLKAIIIGVTETK